MNDQLKKGDPVAYKHEPHRLAGVIERVMEGYPYHGYIRYIQTSGGEFGLVEAKEFVRYEPYPSLVSDIHGTLKLLVEVSAEGLKESGNVHTRGMLDAYVVAIRVVERYAGIRPITPFDYGLNQVSE